MIRPLVDRQFRNVVLDLGADLHAAGAVADHRHSLVLDRGVGGPAGGVPPLSAPGFEAVDVGFDRRVEQAGGADHHVGSRRRRRAVRLADVDIPGWGLSVVGELLHGGLEPDVLANVEGVGHPLQVAPQLVAEAEVVLPVVRSERERVEVIWRVDTCTGIAVLQPDTANGRVTFDHLEWDTGHLQIDGGAQAGYTGADDEHLEPIGNGVGLVVEEFSLSELGGGELAVLARHVLAHRDAEHPDQHFLRGLGDGVGAPGPPGQDRLGGCGPDLALVFLGEPAGVVVAQAGLAPRGVRLFDPAGFAGHLDQHHQQGRNVGGLDGVGEQLLVSWVACAVVFGVHSDSRNRDCC